MAITISKFADQARSYYDDSKVKERSAVSYESPAKGYSTVYKWSLISSQEGGLVEPHVHKGFEILTYVVSGSVDQEESEGGDWATLKAGDVSVLRSGNGLTHSDRYAAETQIFQIWLDPDFRRSLQRPSVFATYEAEDFQTIEFNGMKRIDFCDDESPMYTATRVQLDRFDFEAGEYTLDIEDKYIASFVVISGEVSVEEHDLVAGDYCQIDGASSFTFKAGTAGAIMLLNTPQEAGYRTYTDQLQVSS